MRTRSTILGRRRVVRKAAAAVAAVMIMLIGTLGASSASASATSAPAPAAVGTPTGPHRISLPMTIVGFDPKIAAENGYEIRTDASGHQYSVLKGTASNAARALNDPVVTGSCGTSYIYFNATGNQKASLQTGFNIFYNAVSYGWFVHVSDQNGVGNLSWGGGLWFRKTWEAITTTHNALGYAVAQVDPSSYANLANGGVCTSVSPWDYTYID